MCLKPTLKVSWNVKHIFSRLAGLNFKLANWPHLICSVEAWFDYLVVTHYPEDVWHLALLVQLLFFMPEQYSLVYLCIAEVTGTTKRIFF